MSDWRAMKSAPRDGTAILGYFGMTAGDEPPDMGVTRCVGGQWFSADANGDQWDEPTHWMPLPAPPSGTNGKRKAR
jgi:hypothetical protein